MITPMRVPSYGVALLVALSMADAHLAAAAPQQDTQQVAPSSVVAGRVLTALEGVPLGGAQIAITLVDTGEQASATTGLDGHYAFTDLPSGSYRVVATHDGYSARDYGAPRSMLLGRPLTLADGERREMVDFRLSAAADIVGRVVDPAGAPVAAASVEAVRPLFLDGRVSLAMYAQAEANTNGDFRIRNLAEGHYYVRAYAPRPEDEGDETEIAQNDPLRLPSYYPDRAAAAEALPIVVRPPVSPAPVEVTLRPVRTVTVSGRIISGRGVPLLGGAVTMTPHVDGRVVLGTGLRAEVAPDGTFAFPQVPPGSFMIQARAVDESTPRLQFATFHLTTTDRSISNVFMTLREGARVEGEVVLEAEDVAPEPDMDLLTIRAPTGDPSAVGTEPLTGVRPDGTFALPNMQDAAYGSFGSGTSRRGGRSTPSSTRDGTSPTFRSTSRWVSRHWT